MTAALKVITLETFAHRVQPLPEGQARLMIGRGAEAWLQIDSDRVARRQCELVREGARWFVEDRSSSSGTWLNGRRVQRERLAHGDTLWLGEALVIFLSEVAPRHPELEAALDAQPDDAARAQVYADWWHERSPRDDPGLEGLQALIDEGRLEIDWQHGLMRAARIRCIDDATYSAVELTARLLSHPRARWLRELTVDLATWVMPNAQRLQQDAASVLRGLKAGPLLPCLGRLSLGYVTEALPDATLLPALWQRLQQRLPGLSAPFSQVLPHARRAALELLEVPAGLDFHAPTLQHGQIALDAGLWVGSATPTGQLRALAPGVPRTTAVQSFLVRQQAPQWFLLPLESGLQVNGHPAVATRLLPGDELCDRRGLRFRFSCG